MAKERKTEYSDPKPFEMDCRERQLEIREEVILWSQSREFQNKVKEEVDRVLRDQEELTTLSKRLFENGIFLSKFQEMTAKEIFVNKKDSFWHRYQTLFCVAITALLSALFTYIFGCINKP